MHEALQIDPATGEPPQHLGALNTL